MKNYSRRSIVPSMKVNRIVFRENKYVPWHSKIHINHSLAGRSLNRVVCIAIKMRSHECSYAKARAMFISRPCSCNFPSRYEVSNSPDVIRNELPNEFINSPTRRVFAITFSLFSRLGKERRGGPL